MRAGLLVPGAITDDPREVVQGTSNHLTFGPARSTRVSAELVRRLGAAELRRIDETLQCPDGTPSSCALRTGVAAVAVSAPEVTESTATVRAIVRYQTGSARQPIGRKEVVVTLRVDGGAWVATAVKTVAVT